MSTMIMENMTIGPSVCPGISLGSMDYSTDWVVPVLVGPDIHDASRSRIIIKPRLKEYVKKQREARRTLACFTSLDDPTPEDSESPTSSSSPTTPLTTYKPSTVKALDAPKFLRSSQPEGSKQSIKVHSGRIKKSPKAASKVLADIAKPSRPTSIPTAPRALRFHPAPAAGPTPVALAAVPSAAPTPVAPIPAPAPPLKQRQPCTCHDPEACPYCRFLALADMFCAIVTAREQKLLMGK